jgi:predicted extracellular nuclease
MLPKKLLLTVLLTVLSLAVVQSAAAGLVINEIDYDQPGSDNAEFVEIYNTGPDDVDLFEYRLEFWNGSTTTLYNAFSLLGTLAPGEFHVVCASSTTVANCDQDVTPDANLIQNGAPDAVVLTRLTVIIDTVSYEGDVPGYTETSGAPTDTANPFESINRYPDGVDTDDNSVDFFLRCATPGEPNAPAGLNCEDPVTVDDESWGTIKALFR